MIMAVVGDINGNLAALHAALRAIGEQGIQTILHSGNSIVGGSGFSAIINLLDARAVHCVQGSRDRQLLRFVRKRAQLEQRLDAAEMKALALAFENLDSRLLEGLGALPRARHIEIDGMRLFLCHGLPSSASQTLGPDTTLLRLQREREFAPVDAIICGGGVAPFSRDVSGTRFVCPGHIDDGGGRARYTLLNTEEAPWAIETVTVPIEPSGC